MNAFSFLTWVSAVLEYSGNEVDEVIGRQRHVVNVPHIVGQSLESVSVSLKGGHLGGGNMLQKRGA